MPHSRNVNDSRPRSEACSREQRCGRRFSASSGGSRCSPGSHRPASLPSGWSLRAQEEEVLVPKERPRQRGTSGPPHLSTRLKSIPTLGPSASAPDHQEPDPPASEQRLLSGCGPLSLSECDWTKVHPHVLALASQAKVEIERGDHDKEPSIASSQSSRSPLSQAVH